MMPKATIIRPVFLLLISLTGGCAQNSLAPVVNTPLTTDNLLQNAQATPGERGYPLKLNAAERLLDDERYAEAAKLGDDLRTAHFIGHDLDRYVLMQSDALLHIKNADAALSMLNTMPAPEHLSAPDYIHFLQIRAQAYSMKGEHFDAATTRMLLHSQLKTTESRQENSHEIWSELSKINLPTLDRLRATTSLQTVAGWLDLAGLQARNGRNPDALKSGMNKWRNQYPQHPAMESLPDALAHLASAEKISVQSIAVLLPLSGKMSSSAKQIRDGISAAYAKINAKPWPANAVTLDSTNTNSSFTDSADNHLRFYDTNDANVITVYQQALHDGAEAVIGPLVKDQIQSLINGSNINVPTLTLNTIDGFASNIYQFGLPVEEEAQQVAARALKQYKHALIISSDDSNGERATQAMRDTMLQGGGDVVASIKIGQDEQAQATVSQVMGIDASKNREQTIQKFIGRELSFQPRRRQDVDVILFAVKPSAARRLKPFIDSYFGQNLPVMGVSSLFSGTPSVTLDDVLEGVEFCDLPWLIDTSDTRNEQRQQLSSIVPPGTGAINNRLFALGYDALQLIAELRRLQAVPDYRLDGLTGHLSIDNFGRVHHELTWAKFHEGHLVNSAEGDKH